MKTEEGRYSAKFKLSSTPYYIISACFPILAPIKLVWAITPSVCLGAMDAMTDEPGGWQRPGGRGMHFQ